MMKNFRNDKVDLIDENCRCADLSASLGVSIESWTYTSNTENHSSKIQNFSFNIQNLSFKINYAFRFSSEYFDTVTGLVYYNFRYYSPELGRWLSRDPINSIFVSIVKKMSKTIKEPFIIDDVTIIQLYLIVKQIKFDNQVSNIMRKNKRGYLFCQNSSINYIDKIGLDCPGCDLPPIIAELANKSDCILRACAKHDSCYSEHSCTAQSWVHTIKVLKCMSDAKKNHTQCTMSFNDCEHCNLGVVANMYGCSKGKGIQSGPKYFCAATGKYISIGPNGDFPDKKTADACCCTK